jgi:hypothetical protein
MPEFHVVFRDLLHAVNIRHGTDGFTSEDFFALKNPMAAAGFEPANLGTKGQHATSRPPKPLGYALVLALLFSFSNNIFINYNTIKTDLSPCISFFVFEIYLMMAALDS